MRQAFWEKPWGWRVFRDEAAALKNPMARADGIALCNAMRRWLERGAPRRPDPELVISALSHNSRVLSPTAAIAAAMLARSGRSGGQLLERIFRASPALSRGMLLRFANSREGVPKPAIKRLIALGLEDRSSNVRLFALEAVTSERSHAFAPMVRRLKLRDTDERARDEADFCLHVLRKGYRVTWEQEFREWLVEQSTGTGVTYFYVPARVVRAVGIGRSVKSWLRDNVDEDEFIARYAKRHRTRRATSARDCQVRRF
jgi:hypothetical protein